MASTSWENEKAFVQDIAIKDIIEQEIGALKQRGPHYEGICPFHDDSRTGSFKVTPSKDQWKCFACGEGGDKIDFIRKLYGLDFKGAVHYLSGKFGFVNGGQCDNEGYQKRQVEKKKQKSVKIGSTFVRDGVYSAFYEASDGLTERLKLYLRNERCLKDEDMKDFFIFPRTSSKEFWDRFWEQMKKRKFNSSVLSVIPGFYKKQTGEDAFICYPESYGILCRDVEGSIIGIQIGFLKRRENGPKYIWFSSGNVEANGTGVGGVPSGAPYSILVPEEPRYYAVAITEGYYKAIAFKNTGMVTIDIHGVSNLKGLKRTVGEIAKKMNKTPIIMIGLDADIVDNPAVAKAAKEINELFKDTHKVYIAHWDKECGKGFDDLVNNGYYSKVKKDIAETFLSQL